MSNFAQIEDAVVTALRGLVAAGKPMLSAVAARAWRERKAVVAGMISELAPAAWVMIGGRGSGDKESLRAGAAELSVFYMTRSDRSEVDAQRGAADVVGMHGLCQTAAKALQDLSLADQGRLMLIEERALGGDGGSLFWEQRYEVRPAGSAVVPRFAGAMIAGTDSEVQVELGALERSAGEFAFPGVDGVFERFLGTRSRPIIWRGQLRSASSDALDQIEAGLEGHVRSGQVESVIDANGRWHHHCVMDRFVRKGVRRQDPISGRYLQGFELHFKQLA